MSGTSCDPKQTDTPQHSTALEKIAGADPSDIVGLVAYSLYKLQVREEIIQGGRNRGALKNPSAYQVSFFRNTAEQMVAGFAANAIDEAKPEIQRSAIMDRLEATEVQIIQHVSNSTGMLRSVSISFLGWCVTVVIMLAVVLLGVFPSLEKRLEGMINRSNDAPTIIAPVAPRP